MSQTITSNPIPQFTSEPILNGGLLVPGQYGTIDVTTLPTDPPTWKIKVGVYTLPRPGPGSVSFSVNGTGIGFDDGHHTCMSLYEAAYGVSNVLFADGSITTVLPAAGAYKSIVESWASPSPSISTQQMGSIASALGNLRNSNATI